jgi:hypothetical protein
VRWRRGFFLQVLLKSVVVELEVRLGMEERYEMGGQRCNYYRVIL